MMGCPASEYTCALGSESATPVTLTRSFVLQQVEVTRNDWLELVSTDPTDTDGDGAAECKEGSCPVFAVTWFEAAQYANLLSDRDGLPRCYQLTGCTGEMGAHMVCQEAGLTTPTLYECMGYRLPSEPEWEYAGRAGETTAFYGGDMANQQQWDACESQPNLEGDAWYCFNSGGHPHPVGEKRPNAWGLYDMEGNVFETVQNPYAHGYAQFSAVDPDPEDPTVGDRVAKGGLWNGPANLARIASHYAFSWQYPGPGFRLARTLAGSSW